MGKEGQKPLIITGSAPDVLKDIEAIARLHESEPAAEQLVRYDIMAIGLDAVDKHRLPLDWCATYHPAEIPQILEKRIAAIGSVDFKIISHEPRQGVALCITDWWKPSGSSSLLGVQAALTRLGYRRIILAGCPLTGKNANNNDYAAFRKGWEARIKDLGGYVRSMSGWTADLLGRPDKNWLAAERGSDGKEK